MSIGAGLLQRVAAAVTPEADQAALRRQFPGVPITVCSDDDIPALLTAVHETSAARFYYVEAGGGHCVGLGTDAESATGIVVGLIDDD